MIHWLLGLEPIEFVQKMTAHEKMGNANKVHSAETIAAALCELDAGATLKATGAKYGIAFQYLATLKKNRQRRRDAQVKR